ncbi:MAG: CoA transferase [Deltaproteobacteria bacterium]|nr:CoA transferase [Deltaproteobacteria bacterium]
MENGTTHPRMLAGCKVLDFTQYLAGPTVTRLMAELGADIVKIEPGPGGDPSRLLPFIKEGRSGYFVQQNRGKKSLCIDFNKPEGIDVLKALVKTVDVVVENFGPGVMEKRGLDYASLKKINPKIIMASISAFGRKSPLSHRVGYDLIAQAFSGIMHMTGEADGPPQFVGLGMADVSSGVHAFAALGFALYYREKTGVGQHIDLAMIDALYHMHEVNLQVHALSGGAYVPQRSGSHHPLVCPVGTFKGPKGWIVVLALDRQWEGVCKALGRPELVKDPRFATGADRGKNQKELVAIIESWMQTFATDEEVVAALDQHRVPCAPVMSIVDTLTHPYFKARDMVRQVPDPVFGELTIPGFPFKYSEFPDLPNIQAPLLGEHNAEVLHSQLGYSEKQISELQAKGILFVGNT